MMLPIPKQIQERRFQSMLQVLKGCKIRWLIIRILILDVAYEGARCPIPTLEMLTSHGYHSCARVLVHNGDVLLRYISYSAIINPSSIQQ